MAAIDLDIRPPVAFDAAPLRYSRMTGEAMGRPFAATLAHVFNHGTHRRGQITAAITALGHRCPEIDLVWMLQAESRVP